MSAPAVVDCPICCKPVKEVNINRHIDSSCLDYHETALAPAPNQQQQQQQSQNGFLPKPSQVANFFQTPNGKRNTTSAHGTPSSQQAITQPRASQTPAASLKRPHAFDPIHDGVKEETPNAPVPTPAPAPAPAPKKLKTSANLEKAAPLAERMRPRTLDEVYGQDLVGPSGVLRSLIETDRVPSMILWGGPGTGKTTIARLIAQTAGTRFVEINSTSTGVAECKKLFQEAKNELSLTGRKTIIFCDEIHRFSKSQQDVFLAPVESGAITLIGATTENPSFKVVNALLSRCRTFTLAKLTDEDVFAILRRALQQESSVSPQSLSLMESDDHTLVRYLATFADGDARTALNLLSLALDLSGRPDMTLDAIKSALTQTLVYDRAGDQHYDTISAFHKSLRGSDPDASLYYLTRMLQSGEDPRYIARRMVVVASEDVGLADNSLLSLATATYQACETIGMPECRINLAHCTVALALAPKSTRAYRGMNAAYAALAEPGVAGLPIPIHLRNAPTRLMKELGYGKEYKYNPHYLDGKVQQEYLPERLSGRRFLDDIDLGTKVDPELQEPVTSNDHDDDVEAEVELAHVAEEPSHDAVEDMRSEEDMLLNPDGE
ncbi:hypothetical protein AAFC00_002181 [Neodothiora populina]|uniref:UBZ4-type domain-containing protein n=2 Tax=Neodothiora populina TaxID=2781224 RepID=A0ABR3PHQ7_9PEZI